MNARELSKHATELGFDAAEIKAALLLVAERGISSLDALSSMKSAIQTIKDPTESQEQVMIAYSIGFFTAEGQMKPLSVICDMLREKKEMHDVSLSYLLGADGCRVFEALIEAGFGSGYIQNQQEDTPEHRMKVLSQEKMDLFEKIKHLPAKERQSSEQGKRITVIDEELWKLHKQISEQQKEAK